MLAVGHTQWGMVERGVMEREVGVAGMEAMAFTTVAWCILCAAGGGKSERARYRTRAARDCWAGSHVTPSDGVVLAQVQ